MRIVYSEKIPAILGGLVTVSYIKVAPTELIERLDEKILEAYDLAPQLGGSVQAFLRVLTTDYRFVHALFHDEEFAVNDLRRAGFTASEVDGYLFSLRQALDSGHCFVRYEYELIWKKERP